MVAPLQMRVDVAIQTYMDELLDASSPGELGDALARLARNFGFEALSIFDANGLSDAAGAAPIYSRGAGGRPAVAYSPTSQPVLRFARDADRPVTLDEIRDGLALQGEAWDALAPAWLRRSGGMIVCVPGKTENFWCVGFAGNAAGATGLTRSVLHVGAEVAFRRFGELIGDKGTSETLSAREREVLGLLSGGTSDRDAARELGISLRTVRFHVDNAKRKLGVASRAQAIVQALRTRRVSGRQSVGPDGERTPVSGGKVK